MVGGEEMRGPLYKDVDLFSIDLELFMLDLMLQLLRPQLHLSFVYNF